MNGSCSNSACVVSWLDASTMTSRCISSAKGPPRTTTPSSKSLSIHAACSDQQGCSRLVLPPRHPGPGTKRPQRSCSELPFLLKRIVTANGLWLSSIQEDFPALNSGDRYIALELSTENYIPHVQ